MSNMCVYWVSIYIQHCLANRFIICIWMHICAENTTCFWGWTFITTVFWCSPTVQGFDPSPFLDDTPMLRACSAHAQPRNFGWKFHLQKFTRLEAVYASGAVKVEICTNPCNQHWLHICNIYIIIMIIKIIILIIILIIIMLIIITTTIYIYIYYNT